MRPTGDIDGALVRHRRIYGEADSTPPVDWEAFVLSYAAPWEPAYYLHGLDDAPGAPPDVRTEPQTLGAPLMRRAFTILAPRRAGKGEPAPLGQLLTTGVGLALITIGD